MQVEQEIGLLEQEIQRWQLDYNRYFAGDLELPPVETQERIERRLRELHSARIRRSVDQFRLSGLEARFHTYREMLDRRLRGHEEGRLARTRATPAQAPGHDPERGVVLGVRPDRAAVSALYRRLYATPGQGAAPTVDPERFASYLGQQVEAIRKKTGCREVQFRVVEDGGKLKLKAKAVSTTRSSP